VGTIQGNFDESYGSPGRLHHPAPVKDDRLQRPYGSGADNSDTRTTHTRSRSQEVSVRSLAGDQANGHSFQDDREVRSQGQDQRGVRSQDGDHREVVSEGRSRGNSERRETESRIRDYSSERRPKNSCDNYEEVEEME
jgi:hypothetical protein